MPVESAASGDVRLSDGGRFAVKVMALGASHAMDHVTNALLPIFLLGVTRLLATRYFTRRERASPTGVRTVVSNPVAGGGNRETA